jgi:putative transposase
LSGRGNYTERNLIEKWFHTLKMRVDRFHNSWVGSRASVREWFAQFMHYYNHQRLHQALNVLATYGRNVAPNLAIHIDERSCEARC